MPDLDFEVVGAEPVPYCATPTLALRLRIVNRSEELVHDVLLECQLRIEAQRRPYRAGERPRLFELFGEPSRWSQTLRGLLWTHAGVRVPPFRGETVVDLHVPCTFDFNLQVAKYFDALQDGAVPILLLFSGSIFYAGPSGELSVARISWSKEAVYDLPVAAWRGLTEMYYPNTAWLCLRKDVFDRLAAYKAKRALPTWEQALESLVDAIELDRGTPSGVEGG